MQKLRRTNSIIYGFAVTIIFLIIAKVIPLLFQNINIQWESDMFYYCYKGITIEIIAICIVLFEFRRVRLNKLLKRSFLEIQTPYYYLFALLCLLFFTSGLSDFRSIPLNFLNSRLVLLFVVTCLCIGTLEELLFRVLILNNLLRGLASSKNYLLKAVFISSAIFGLAHISNVLIRHVSFSGVLFQVIAVFNLGVLFCAIYIRTRNIVPLILIHAAIDFFSGIPQLFPDIFSPQQATEVGLSKYFVSLFLAVVFYGVFSVIGYSLLIEKNRENNQMLRDEKQKVYS